MQEVFKGEGYDADDVHFMLSFYLKARFHKEASLAENIQLSDLSSRIKPSQLGSGPGNRKRGGRGGSRRGL